MPGPTACACCGSTRLAKLGEDVTETLEVVPRQWKVMQYVREKFTCRACERISQAPAPFHVLPRGFAGPSLLAMIVFHQCGRRSTAQPPGRTVYPRRHGALACRPLPTRSAAAPRFCTRFTISSALMFSPAAVSTATTPRCRFWPKARRRTGRLWTYVRDDRPFGGRDPPAAVFFYSRDRAGDHPERHLNGYAGDPPGRCLCGLQPALCGRPSSGADYGGCLLVARRTQILCARRRHREGARQAGGHRAAGAGGG